MFNNCYCSQCFFKIKWGIWLLDSWAVFMETEEKCWSFFQVFVVLFISACWSGIGWGHCWDGQFEKCFNTTSIKTLRPIILYVLEVLDFEFLVLFSVSTVCNLFLFCHSFIRRLLNFITLHVLLQMFFRNFKRCRMFSKRYWFCHIFRSCCFIVISNIKKVLFCLVRSWLRPKWKSIVSLVIKRKFGSY